MKSKEMQLFKTYCIVNGSIDTPPMKFPGNLKQLQLNLRTLKRCSLDLMISKSTSDFYRDNSIQTTQILAHQLFPLVCALSL